MDRPRYIVIEGPIGVGKSTLTRILSERFGARTVFEIVEENPFLSQFYGDRDKYAFQTQLFFLLSRFKQQEGLGQEDLFSGGTVSDYLFAKDRIFAALTLTDAELALYDRIFQLLAPRIPKPDLVIYLQARMDVLLGRIKKRARPFEKDFDAEYLSRLCSAYNDFFFHYDETPLLVINTSDINVVDNPDDVDQLVGVIRRHRKGVTHYIPRGSVPQD